MNLRRRSAGLPDLYYANRNHDASSTVSTLRDSLTVERCASLIDPVV